jgi:hypothetical protein
MNERERVKEINDRYGRIVNENRKTIANLMECWDRELRAVRAGCNHVDDGHLLEGHCKKCGEELG